jgi:effector-binding domain-containing protein
MPGDAKSATRRTAMDVQIKEAPAMTVAYLAMQGPLTQIPTAMGVLYRWVTQHGMEPRGMPTSVYYTMPPEVPLEESAWELWSPVAPGAALTERNAEGLGVRHVESATVVSTLYTGPYEAIGPVYAELMAWMPANGYEVVGAPRELYFSPPETPPDDTVTEIQFPARQA